jgi:heme a synthase
MPTVHWSEEIPGERRRSMRVWLWSVAAMTFAVLVIGGITRLTLSGLSIVDWKPLMGVLPPLSDGQWEATFELYRQFPEYQTWRSGMSMAEFKFIFFWEYLHRLVARGIGLVFLVPFVVFWLRGWFPRPLLKRALLLFALGAMQGVMGWFMVKSGLVDRPSVSHFRLAAHLSLAFVIFGWAVWLARDLALGSGAKSESVAGRAAATRADTAARINAGERTLMLRGLSVVGGLLAVQIVWGAFVAGLKAGRFYTTFPLMGGRLVPAELGIETVVRDVVSTPIGVQWMHRVLGTLLLAVTIAFFMMVRSRVSDVISLRFSTAVLSILALQYALGILTLVYMVPVSLGVIHQAVAMVLFGVWLCWTHHVVRDSAAASRVASGRDPGPAVAAAAWEPSR